MLLTLKTDRQEPTPQSLWLSGQMFQRCNAPGCACLFTIRELRKGAGRQYNEHPEHDFAPCGHSYTWYGASPVRSPRAIPALHETCTIDADTYLYADDSGRPWLCVNDELRSLQGWGAHLSAWVRHEIYLIVGEWMHSDRALTLWFERDPRFAAAEALVEAWRTEVDANTATLEFDNYSLGDFDVVERAA